MRTNFCSQGSRRRASSMPVVLAFVTVGMVIAGGVLSLSSTSSRLTFRSEGKAQSVSLAESGVHALYAAIRHDMRADGTYPGSVNGTITAGGKAIGTYTGTVLSVQNWAADINDASGTKIGETQSYRFKVRGVGTSNGGVDSQVEAEFTGSVKLLSTGGSGTVLTLQPAAIAANEKVYMRTDNVPLGIITEDQGASHQAHVVGNEGITWEPCSQPKACTSSADWIKADGGFLVKQSAYNWTTSPLGLGNSNGSKNFACSDLIEDAYHLSNDKNQVGKLVTQYDFPSQTKVDSMQSLWTSLASAGDSHTGHMYSSSAPTRLSDGKHVLKAPFFQDGHMTIDGELVLEPSDDPTQNVIYIRGSIDNVGTIVNHGVTVVMEGYYQDHAGSAYKLDDSVPGELNDIRKKAALISLAQSQSAIHMSTNQSTETGLVYSARGGILVDGPNLTLGGMFLGGGEGVLGTVQLYPQSGSKFEADYNTMYATSRSWGTVDSGTTSVSVPFNPGRLTHWNQKK